MPDSAIALNTKSRCFKWSSKDLEKMTISSMYTNANIHKNGARTSCITLWNTAGPLRKPNGMRRNWYKPRCVLNAVFSRSSGLICSWVNPAKASKVDNQFAPVRVCNISS